LAGFCEYGNESSGSGECEELPEYLRTQCNVKKDSAPFSWSVSLSVRQSVGRLVSQSVGQSFSQSVSHSVSPTHINILGRMF